MKAVIQRVVNASVAVDGRTISSIGKGLLVLVGIDRYDTPADATQIVKKILSARLFDDDQGAFWKKSVKEIGGEVLCVSQFTLLANFKGSKPDFHESMSTIPGKAFYAQFMDEIKRAYQPDKIKDGEFGAMMQVSLTNDGPVTILLSSRDKPSKGSTTDVSASGRSTPGGSGNTSAGASGSASGSGMKKVKKVNPRKLLNSKLQSQSETTSSPLSNASPASTSRLTGESSNNPRHPQLSSVLSPIHPSEDGEHRSADMLDEPDVARTSFQTTSVGVSPGVGEGETDVDPSRRGAGDVDHLSEKQNQVGAEAGAGAVIDRQGGGDDLDLRMRKLDV